MFSNADSNLVPLPAARTFDTISHAYSILVVSASAVKLNTSSKFRCGTSKRWWLPVRGCISLHELKRSHDGIV